MSLQRGRQQRVSFWVSYLLKQGDLKKHELDKNVGNVKGNGILMRTLYTMNRTDAPYPKQSATIGGKNKHLKHVSHCGFHSTSPCLWTEARAFEGRLTVSRGEQV